MILEITDTTSMPLKCNYYYVFLFFSILQTRLLQLTGDGGCYYPTSEVGSPSRWGGTTRSGLSYAEFACKPGCYVKSIGVVQINGKIGGIIFKCSDESLSPLFGKDGSSGLWWKATYGFVNMLVCADYSSNIWGMKVYSAVDNTESGTIGQTEGCLKTSNLQCGKGTNNMNKVITGANIYYDPSGVISSILTVCHTVQCSPFGHTNSYMDENTRACHWCANIAIEYCSGRTYRANCGGISSGYCTACEDCLPGEFRYGCMYASPGECRSCNACSNGKYLTKCDGTTSYDTGLCIECDYKLCGQGTYLSGCGGLSAGQCLPCLSCSAAQYVTGCSEGNSGTCVSCGGCPSGYYRSGCSGMNPGSCARCTTCPSGTYLSGCGYLESGSCKDCEICAKGKYMSGCGGVSSGTCIDCVSCHAGRYRESCGPTTAGMCYDCLPGTYSNAGDNICSTCTFTLPEQGLFTSLCLWRCNSGFFKDTSTSCAKCASSDSCPVGKFRPYCEDGINYQTCSGQCTNKPSDPQTIYTSPSSDHTEKNCLWACNIGYYKNNLINKCEICSKNCSVGEYPSGVCISQISEQPPECLACDPVNNAVFTSSGIFNSPASCQFLCQGKFYSTDSQMYECKPWTPRACGSGYFLELGNATSDTVCKICPNYKENARVYVFNQNVCTYQCGVGHESSSNNTCAECPPGKYQPTSSLNPCRVCPLNMYQENFGSDACKSVPENGIAIDSQTDFSCNSGYFRLPPQPPHQSEPSCAKCQNNDDVKLAKAKSLVWNSCTISSLSCNAGYYRNWTYEGCIPCPSAIPNNSVSVIVSITTCPTCRNASEYDRHISCPFQCNIGYYLAPNFNYSCIRCSILSCSTGLYLQLCSSGRVSNECLKCNYQLKAFQIWTYTTECQWHCIEGYFLHGTNMACVVCPAGTYKTFQGNQSCIDCAKGSYSSTSLTCRFCDRGSYSNTSASTVCTLCEKGTYAPMQNSTVCNRCLDVSTYPSSISTSSGATECFLCTALTPYSRDGIVCSLPIPPCPKGFYLHYQKTHCDLCPIGTYCDTQGESYPKNCLFSKPFSVLPATSVNNCTQTNPFQEENTWRVPCAAPLA